MTTKRITPYERLLRTARQYAFNVANPKTKTMFCFEKRSLNTGWALDDVAQRVVAADTLGYDVCLSVDDNGNLYMKYVERAEVPWELK